MVEIMTFAPFIIIAWNDPTLKPNTSFKTNTCVTMHYIKVATIIGLNCFFSNSLSVKTSA